MERSNKRILLYSDDGSKLIDFNIPEEQEARFKSSINDTLLYNLVFISVEHKEKGYLYDYIEDTEVDGYNNKLLTCHNTFDYIQELFPYSSSIREKFIGIVKQFHEFVRRKEPRWIDAIMSGESVWQDMQVKSRNLLLELGLDYSKLDIDSYREMMHGSRVKGKSGTPPSE